MASPGYNLDIKKSGTATAMTGEAMTSLGDYTWQITDTAKRALERDEPITIYEDGSELNNTIIESVDYMFGIIELTIIFNGTITIDATYVPLSSIAGAKECTMNETSVIQDSTDISNSGYHQKETTLHDVSMTISRFDDISGDFVEIVNNRARVLIEFSPDGSKLYRGWFVAESSDKSIELSGLAEETINFQLSGGRDALKSFSES